MKSPRTPRERWTTDCRQMNPEQKREHRLSVRRAAHTERMVHKAIRMDVFRQKLRKMIDDA